MCQFRRLVGGQPAGAGQRGKKCAIDAPGDICAGAGLEFVWSLVKDNKGHMDRARYLSLTYGATTAFVEHREILAALRDRDPEAAADAIQRHLSHIEAIIARLHIDRPEMFPALS